ncbi:hypothetical protein IRZ59_04825 [Pseudomonas guariconensis]|uniref:hypothetical protein n=1 Tax=Pseudomonas guariconensis TaxID=1288410 RepID=UPI0018AAD75C|nr:hypothetical protein [Pseudomonas guariconensis]MBF8729760.1 hypothetical protein [Pseudomonas guariconensis]
MNSAIEAIGLIIDGSRRLEQQLREIGAVGTGLKELSESVADRLSPGDIAKIRRVYVLRNKVAHDTFEVDQAALAQFLADVEHLLAELKPDDDPDAAMRKRIRESDFVDDEIYEWLKLEAKRREEAKLSSVPELQGQDSGTAQSATAALTKSFDHSAGLERGTVTSVSDSQTAKKLKESAKDAAVNVALRALISFIK